MIIFYVKKIKYKFSIHTKYKQHNMLLFILFIFIKKYVIEQHCLRCIDKKIIKLSYLYLYYNISYINFSFPNL